MQLSLERRRRRFAQPLQTAHGTLTARDLIEIALTDEDGVRGHGEAAPLELYDGVSTDSVLGALHAYRDVVAGRPDGDRPALLDRCRAVADVPQALAAIDMALWDMAGRRAGKPVCELLSESLANEITVNATVGATDPEAAADAAAQAVGAGYSCVKLKVGTGDDLERVRRVRAAIGPHPRLRLDANGAWSVDQAVSLLDAMGAFGLELVEEPVRGLEAMQDLRERVAVRIAIDETAALPGALTARVADAVCLKISRCGGIGGLLAAASLVRSSGADVYLASTYDGPVGIAAALHAAAALSPLPACGLATLGLFEGEPSPFPVHDGAIAVPSGPGLGVSPA
jgi:L-alanine-DL-glutamate epimerase-like enolase superfamily enzyme